MVLSYNEQLKKYQIDHVIIESGYMLEIYDEVSKEWFKGRVGYSDTYEQKYYLTLITCGGGELGFVDLKYYETARIV